MNPTNRLGKYAELGPLDAQIFDPEREGRLSALERLQAQSLEIIDQTIMYLRLRSGKKIDTLLPQVLEYTSKLMRPMVLSLIMKKLRESD